MDLRAALQNLLDHYVELVESGDAGFWDVEKEQVVIDARDVLARSATLPGLPGMPEDQIRINLNHG